ncbi:MAG: sigma-70 family RNA polymerase sigma factor [Acidobacteria bacterium]|nr:sigma-70 family RNA polymerase sigma factor [Acidobacteriota bacterium]
MNKRILVVDDEAFIVDGLTALFDCEQFESKGAFDRQQAMDILDEDFYPVIVSDLCLGSQEDGLLLLEHIRETSPRSRVVVLTGYASSEMNEHLRERGVATVMQKPATGEEILDVINALIAELEQEASATNEPVDMDALYETMHPRLHAIARGRFRLSPERADDVVQEAWLLFLRKRGEIRAASPWLAGTVANLSRQELDQKTRRREEPDGETALSTLVIGDGEELTQSLFLRQALERADERTRTLCSLIGIEGLSYQKVSEITGMPVGSIGPLYIRAKQKMRDLLSH